jgi:hypothetical protein
MTFELFPNLLFGIPAFGYAFCRDPYMPIFRRARHSTVEHDLGELDVIRAEPSQITIRCYCRTFNKARECSN